jgi:hypothetical protein
LFLTDYCAKASSHDWGQACIPALFCWGQACIPALFCWNLLAAIISAQENNADHN